MALSKQKLKSRINSINSTMKITSAMELIANVKLQKQRQFVENNKEYSKILKETVSKIVSQNKDVECEYLIENTGNETVTIVFGSDMGLCGGYNSNIVKFLLDENKKDKLIVVGKKLYTTLKNKGFNLLNDEIPSDNLEFSTIKKAISKVVNEFKNSKISKIQVLYTEFVNTVTFKPTLETILPIKIDDTNTNDKEIEFEPEGSEILNHLIPMMIENVVYNYYLQSKTSEQASRRLAMETATDNAQELSEQLLLKFNQARQASITQEITEIVGGAEAL